jgi:RNA polymerase sigma-70 factor (ECF subfamily)
MTEHANAIEHELDRAMDLWAAGDAAAFADVHALVHPRLRGLCARLAASKSDPRDLLQDVWVRIVRSRATFRPGSATWPWIRSVARSVHIDNERSRKRRPALAHDELAFDRHAVDSAESPHAQVEARSVMTVVSRALDEIPQAQRAAFALLKAHGLTVAQASHSLGTTETAVKLRVHRACNAIRAALDHAFEDFAQAG